MSAASPAQSSNVKSQHRPHEAHRLPLKRASAACVSCRAGRMRCIRVPGQTSCKSCSQRSRPCIFTGSDERKKPRSRQYVNHLADEVQALRQRLMSMQQDSTAACTLTTVTTNESQDSQPTPPREADERGQSGVVPETLDPLNTGSITDCIVDDAHLPSRQEHIPITVPGSVVSHIASIRARKSVNAMDRRLRYFYFGPVTNSAVLLSQDELDIECPSTDGPDGRRARALIRSVSHETHDYLMTLYWSSFNQVLPVINRKAYEDDFTSRSVGYYSNLLHLCQLAMGFRFSDKTRQDMKALARGSFESIFHQEAKYMIDTEIEQPRGLPTISALLLMGDLECGVGRDNVGWMMHAMAIRIALDLRLNLAPSHCETQLNQEAWLGRQTLWACTVYDCYWALFGQRPTTIKVEEIEVDLCTPNQDGADAFDPSKGEAFSAGRVYGALLELMSIAGRIYSDPETLRTPRISELHKTSLKRELQCWYAQLDGSLTLTPENIREASPDMFLLHQQYHSMLILLHWPLVESPGVGGITNYFDMTQQRQREVMNALHICRKSAVAVTRIYQEYMKRFDPTKLFITCVQHIVTAASALIASCQIGGVSSDTCIQQLRILSTVITAAATTYKPAGIIRTLLEEALTELSLDLPYRLGSSSSAPLDTLVNLNGDTFEWNLAHFVNDTCTEPEESWVSCLLHNSGRAEQFAYS